VIGGITMHGIPCLISTALIALLPTVSEAHDAYTNLKNRFGKSCCDDQHCRPAPYRINRSGAIEMLIDQQWLAIPSDVVEYRALDGDTGETNGAHWCGGEMGDFGMTYTYCAFLPPKLGFLKLSPPK